GLEQNAARSETAGRDHRENRREISRSLRAADRSCAYRIVGRLCQTPLSNAAFHRNALQIQPNNSLTIDFSSFSSATDASNFARLNSFSGTSCTISHLPPRD